MGFNKVLQHSFAGHFDCFTVVPAAFRSEADFITENDAPSASSLPYDDIAEATEAQPLNPSGTMAVASRDSYMNDDGLGENAGKF